MADGKKTLFQHGLKLLSDPRVARLVQDERVMKSLVAAMSLPGKAQTFVKEQVEHLAKAMDLATEAEVRDLRRTVRRLEDEMAQLKHPGSEAERRSG
jgi:hypothetical protein